MKQYFALAALLIAAVQAPAFAQMVQPTRFGLLTTDDQQMLVLDGQPFEQPIHLAQPDHTMVRFELETADVIFFRQDKGSDCPQKFAIVQISKEGAKGLPDLGSCSNTAIQPWRENQVIRFSQPEANSSAVIHYEYQASSGLTQTQEQTAPSQ